MKIELGRHPLETPAICGAIIGEDVDAMSSGVARAIKLGADLIELRLDGLRRRIGWERLFEGKMPSILTIRTKREGGHFEGDERGRIEFVLEGIEKGPACVDIELSTQKRLLNKVINGARDRGTSILISHHDFAATPSVDAMMETVKRMVRVDCDIAKIVTFAKEPRDSLRVLDFLVQVPDAVDVPVIAFAMGEAGVLSRIAGAMFGSPIIYAAVDEATAPGQFDITTTKRLLREFGLRG